MAAAVMIREGRADRRPARHQYRCHQEVTVALRRRGRRDHAGSVLTLVVAPDSESLLEESIEAANAASREHPCRVIVVIPGDRLTTEPRLSL